MRRNSRGVDMSPEAIDRRLRDLSQLYDFARQVKGARWLGEVKDVEERRSSTRNPSTLDPVFRGFGDL